MPVWQYSEKVAKESISVQRKCAAAAVAMTQVKRPSNADAEWSGGDDDFLSSEHSGLRISSVPFWTYIFQMGWNSVETTNQFIFNVCTQVNLLSVFLCFSAPGSRWKIASDRSWYGGATTKSTISGGLGICLVFIRFMAGWWFQILFYSHPYLGKWSNLTWLIFFRWVETTN